MLSTLSTSSADCASRRRYAPVTHFGCTVGVLGGALGVEGNGGAPR